MLVVVGSHRFNAAVHVPVPGRPKPGPKTLLTQHKISIEGSVPQQSPTTHPKKIIVNFDRTCRSLQTTIFVDPSGPGTKPLFLLIHPRRPPETLVTLQRPRKLLLLSIQRLLGASKLFVLVQRLQGASELLSLWTQLIPELDLPASRTKNFEQLCCAYFALKH